MNGSGMDPEAGTRPRVYPSRVHGMARESRLGSPSRGCFAWVVGAVLDRVRVDWLACRKRRDLGCGARRGGRQTQRAKKGRVQRSAAQAGGGESMRSAGALSRRTEGRGRQLRHVRAGRENLGWETMESGKKNRRVAAARRTGRDFRHLHTAALGAGTAHRSTSPRGCEVPLRGKVCTYLASSSTSSPAPRREAKPCQYQYL